MRITDDLTLKQEEWAAYRISYKPEHKEVLFYSYHPKYKLVVNKWKGCLSKKLIRDVYHFMYLLAKERGYYIQVSIIDLTDIECSFHNAMEKIFHDLISRPLKGDYQFIYFVKPKQHSSGATIDNLIKNLSCIKCYKEIRVFESYEMAFQYVSQHSKDSLTESL